MASLSNIITPTNVLTASNTVTLTNKTISGSSNTITNVPLSTAVTGTLPVANGGTGASSLSAAGILTTASAVTVAQGGTGATSLTANNVLLGNGTSAVQVVAPGSSGNVLTSNGTTWASAAASTGALVYIATATASNSAQVRFESELTSTYDNYLIVFNGVIPATDYVYFRARLKVDGSYQTSNYASNTLYAYYGSSTPTNHYNSTEMTIIRYSMTNSSSYSGQGQIYLSTPTNTTRYKTLNWTAMSNGLDSQIDIGQGSYINSTSAVTGIEFYMSSGNVSAGTFRIYGIKNS